MNSLCTRCNRPIGHIAKVTPKGPMHQACWEYEQAMKEREGTELARLRADRDRLLAALKGMWEWQTIVQEFVPDELAEEVTEAIRLSEKEE